MRRKIAKRLRKKIIARGAEIVSEEWVYPEDAVGKVKRKDKAFFVEVKHCGWSISSGGMDELEAYRGAYECFGIAEEEPFDEVKWSNHDKD